MPYKDKAKGRARKRDYCRKWRLANPDYDREYKKNHKEEKAACEDRHRARFPERSSARGKVNYRVAKGKWPKPSVFICTDCSAPAEHYHHEDYSIWWSVEPLCRACHVKRHRQT